MRNLPKIVNIICHQCDAWLVGSAANPLNENPRDYDILVPFYQWHNAVTRLPLDICKPNSFGGWKFIDTESNKSIDVWPGDLSWLSQRPMFKYAYHPLTDSRIAKV